MDMKRNPFFNAWVLNRKKMECAPRSAARRFSPSLHQGVGGNLFLDSGDELNEGRQDAASAETAAVALVSLQADRLPPMARCSHDGLAVESRRNNNGPGLKALQIRCFFRVLKRPAPSAMFEFHL